VGPIVGVADFQARLQRHVEKIEAREQRRTFLRGFLKAASYLKLEGDEQDG
jgi:hypothetical protein